MSTDSTHLILDVFDASKSLQCLSLRAHIIFVQEIAEQHVVYHWSSLFDFRHPVSGIVSVLMASIKSHLEVLFVVIHSLDHAQNLKAL